MAAKARRLRPAVRHWPGSGPAGRGRRVAELRKEGLIRDVSLKAVRTGPVPVLNDTNARDAPARLASLPFVEHELVTFDYIELDDSSPA